VTFSADAKFLAFGNGDGLIKLYNIDKILEAKASDQTFDIFK
jgi:hypothetical protein